MKTITIRLDDGIGDRVDATVEAERTSIQAWGEKLILEALEPAPAPEAITARVAEIDGHDSAKALSYLAALSESKPRLRADLGRALNCPAVTKQNR